MDPAALFGTLVGILAILLGQVLEGGALGQLFQFTAGVVVFGGTFGALLLSFPWSEVEHAFLQLGDVYGKKRKRNLPRVQAEILNVANLARKEGILVIDSERKKVKNAEFKKSLRYIIDGFDSSAVREIMDAKVEQEFDLRERAARVFDSAGGYAPTIGIVGAVLGLIHVMSRLEDPSKVGIGIAVAFVATLYGVGFANLVLFPWASRIRRLADERVKEIRMVEEGIVGIQEGLNPLFLKEKISLIANTDHVKA